jgi:hypothetical protein
MSHLLGIVILTFNAVGAAGAPMTNTLVAVLLLYTFPSVAEQNAAEHLSTRTETTNSVPSTSVANGRSTVRKGTFEQYRSAERALTLLQPNWLD